MKPYIFVIFRGVGGGGGGGIRTCRCCMFKDCIPPNKSSCSYEKTPVNMRLYFRTCAFMKETGYHMHFLALFLRNHSADI